MKFILISLIRMDNIVIIDSKSNEKTNINIIPTCRR